MREFDFSNLKLFNPLFRLLVKIRGENPETVHVQRRVAAKICFELGQQMLDEKKVDLAIEYFQEALKSDDAHEKVC